MSSKTKCDSQEVGPKLEMTDMFYIERVEGDHFMIETEDESELKTVNIAITYIRPDTKNYCQYKKSIKYLKNKKSTKCQKLCSSK